MTDATVARPAATLTWMDRAQRIDPRYPPSEPGVEKTIIPE